MRVLVVSDIHGNWEALRTVAANERYDQVICLGDVVDYGPQPVEAVSRLFRSPAAASRGSAIVGDADAPLPSVHVEELVLGDAGLLEDRPGGAFS